MWMPEANSTDPISSFQCDHVHPCIYTDASFCGLHSFSFSCPLPDTSLPDVTFVVDWARTKNLFIPEQLTSNIEQAHINRDPSRL